MRQFLGAERKFKLPVDRGRKKCSKVWPTCDNARQMSQKVMTIIVSDSRRMTHDVVSAIRIWLSLLNFILKHI